MYDLCTGDGVSCWLSPAYLWAEPTFQGVKVNAEAPFPEPPHMGPHCRVFLVQEGGVGTVREAGPSWWMSRKEAAMLGNARDGGIQDHREEGTLMPG